MLEGPSREGSVVVVRRDPVDQAGEGRILRGGGGEEVQARNRISYEEVSLRIRNCTDPVRGIVDKKKKLSRMRYSIKTRQRAP